MKIDVAVMTRNSDRFIEDCLSHIEKAVDLNRLIIVDGNSTDDTLKIAKKHNAKILNDGGLGLGYARMLAIRNIETPWFAFVDSDIMLPSEWQKQVLGYKLYKPGGIESKTFNIAFSGEEAVTNLHNKAMEHRYNYAKELKGKPARGFTGATLIRTDLVKDIKIPQIPCCEDWWITQHILSKGYKWWKVPVDVQHYDRFSERPTRIRQTHGMARILGYMPLHQLIAKTVNAFIGRLILSIVYRTPQYFLHRIRYSLNAFEGWLHPDKYVKQHYPGWDP